MAVFKAGQPQCLFYQRWPLYQGRWPSQWPNGRFINQKQPNGHIIGFGARIAIFTISRVKNLSTAGPCAYLRFQEERKGNLVDPASSHMLVSRRNMAVFKAGQPQWPFYQRWPLYQGRWPSQWTNGRFINQKRPNGQTIGLGARIAIFTISRVKNFSTAGPCAYLRFQEERKGNLVDPASSHMLV